MDAEGLKTLFEVTKRFGLNKAAALASIMAMSPAIAFPEERPPRKTMANFSKRRDPIRRRKRKLAKVSRRRNRR